MSLQEFLAALLGPVGLLIALLAILWMGTQGVWVFGSYHRAMMAAWEERYDEMKAELRLRIDGLEKRLDRAGHVAEGSTGLARRAMDQAEQRRSED